MAGGLQGGARQLQRLAPSQEKLAHLGLQLAPSRSFTNASTRYMAFCYSLKRLYEVPFYVRAVPVHNVHAVPASVPLLVG